jgi:2-dehydro-3-deoxyphosphogluconate aldolase / (4S)-4-hydroxy-2-oxoglutarate aldolase
MTTKKETLDRIKAAGLLAVIRGPSKNLTITMVKALISGGVTGIEITYSTPQAEDVVRDLRDAYGDSILLGMGTLTKPEQTRTAKEAGANFIVSPICEPALVRAMVESGLATMAGALTPTEIFQAHHMGIDIVKLFPGSLAGPKYIKAIHGPLPDIDIMPTGGVSRENLRDWFQAGAVAVGAGSALCPKNLAAEGKFDEITQRAAEFVELVRKERA